MNDTPRTDKQINGNPCTRFGIMAGDSLRDAMVPSEFARELERELTAAREEITILKSKYADHHAEAERLTSEIRSVAKQRDRLAEAVIRFSQGTCSTHFLLDLAVAATKGNTND
jgi:hypothetical protein